MFKYVDLFLSLSLVYIKLLNGTKEEHKYIRTGFLVKIGNLEKTRLRNPKQLNLSFNESQSCMILLPLNTPLRKEWVLVRVGGGKWSILGT